MRIIIIYSALWLLCLSTGVMKNGPDLTKKEDLKALGIGKIFEKDKTITTKMALEEVSEYYIVFIKNDSLHDMATDKINRIEFEETKWGAIKIEFNDNKSRIIMLN